MSLLRRIEKGGQFWFATTSMKGKTWLRVNPVNIYTTLAHMNSLFELLKQTCQEVYEEMKSKDVAVGREN